MKKKEIRSKLFDMQDIDYKKFHCKLIPGVNPDKVIGVRTPALRKLAKEVFKSGDYGEFISDLPHEYYEELNLHGMIICMINDYLLVPKSTFTFSRSASDETSNIGFASYPNILAMIAEGNTLHFTLNFFTTAL